MENRYLCRGKRKDNGKWVEGNLVQTVGGSYIVVPYKHETILEEGSVIEIDPSTICQCTGLRDKNGKLIYENDIVRVCWQDNEAQCEEIAQVAWDEFGYYPWLDEYHCDGCDLFNEVRDIEVIGNRFDNPELLEG